MTCGKTQCFIIATPYCAYVACCSGRSWPFRPMPGQRRRNSRAKGSGQGTSGRDGKRRTHQASSQAHCVIAIASPCTRSRQSARVFRFLRLSSNPGRWQRPCAEAAPASCRCTAFEPGLHLGEGQKPMARQPCFGTRDLFVSPRTCDRSDAMVASSGRGCSGSFSRALACLPAIFSRATALNSSAGATLRTWARTSAIAHSLHTASFRDHRF